MYVSVYVTMNMYNIYIYIHIHTCMHCMNVYVRMYAGMYVRNACMLCMCVCIFEFMHIWICEYVCMIFMHVCMQVSE